MDDVLMDNEQQKKPDRFKTVMAMMSAFQQPSMPPVQTAQAPVKQEQVQQEHNDLGFIPAEQIDRKPTSLPSAKKKPSNTMDMNSFLRVIGHLESSSGRNFGHQEMQKGMHKGHSAIGTYGLMPNTVDDIIDNIKDAPEHVKAIKNMSPDQKKQFLETNPQYEEYLAKHLAQRVMRRYKSPEKAAYAWHQGHYINPSKIDNKKLQHEYVQRFKKIRQGIAKRDLDSE